MSYSDSDKAGSPMRTRPASRINMDIERVNGLTKSILLARDRVQRQTTNLGYFSKEETNQTSDGAKVSPISDNMQLALTDLERAIEHLQGALNLFD